MDTEILLDTGAIRSCMNYNTYMKLKHIHINQANTPPVVGADGSDLGAMGTVTCELQMGGKTVSQEFIV